MPKQQRSSRGVAAPEMGNFRYERPDDSSGLEHRRRAPPVDRDLLKRAYMLQNFQFIIRQDVQEMKSSSALPQSQRRFLETLFSCDSAAPWDAVTAVVVRLTDVEFHCPICLDPPTAARITSCGHTFCLPCMLQHLALRRAEKQPRTCPVCQSFVTEGMLRPCILRFVTAPCVGFPARFTLLRCAPGARAVLRLPDDADTDAAAEKEKEKEKEEAPGEIPLPRYGDPSAAFSRYVLATASSGAELRARDELDLACALDAADRLPRPHTQFDAAAVHFLIAALEAARTDPMANTAATTATATATAALGPTGPGAVRASPPFAPQPREEDRAPRDLYGASDGQPYYLHTVCYKMLRHDAEARGAPLPRFVEAPVESIVTLTQDAATRRHYKAFAHVPLHGTLRLCVLDLSGAVRPATLAAFAGSLARLRRDGAAAAAAAAGGRGGAGEGEEDSSWQAYLRRYRAGAPPPPLEDRSPDAAASEWSCGSAGWPPLLELPSANEGTPVESPAGGTGFESAWAQGSAREGSGPGSACKAKGPAATCWTAVEPRQALATPPLRPAVPTWGGHVFNPRKPPSATK